MQWNEFHSHSRHLTAKNQKRVEEAFRLGEHAHGGQTRRSGDPYFSHPIAVARMLAELRADADTIIAALLHDTIEDTPLTLEEINAKFGGTVRSLIDGVTKLRAEDLQSRPSLDEQTETLRKIFTLMEEDVRIMVMKLYDRLHNMQTADFLPEDRRRTLAQETFDVYVKIADRLCMQDLRDELEGLCIAILDRNLFDQLSMLRMRNEQQGQGVIEQIRKLLLEEQPEAMKGVAIRFESKTWGQLKLSLETTSSATGISDVIAAFTCESMDTCYRLLGSLHQIWQREILSFQDFINAPSINGYRGLHTTVILNDGTRVRCKIRTQEMFEYARKGVTLHCFDRKSNVLTVLPWTKRISSLSRDTTGRSQDFWQSLQSDILGESIVIHGPGAETVQLPKGATALDGAFYLFHENALNTKKLFVNGREVSLASVLSNADSLAATFDEFETVQRTWLKWVQTGLAAATIRSGLAEQSEQERAGIGRQMLQNTMLKKRRGFIEEFDQRTLEQRGQQLGYHSLHDLFIAIADGRVEVSKADDILFEEEKHREKQERTRRCIIRYSIDMDDVDGMDRVNQVHRSHGTLIEQINYRRGAKGKDHVVLSMRLKPSEELAFTQALSAAGVGDIDVVKRTRQEELLLTVVILLWALNPVYAKWLLIRGMEPLTLITLRFLTIALYTTGFFVLWRMVSGKRYSPIPRVTLLAGIPTLANAGMSLYYFALASIPPSVHLTILRFNTLLLPLLQLSRRKHGYRPLLSFLLLLSAIAGLIIFSLGSSVSLGLLFSITTLIFYTLYSLTTERTLQHHHIDVRTPYFLFQVGILSGILGIILLAFIDITTLVNPMTVHAIVYLLLCVCLSQTLYSFLLKTSRFKHFTDLLLLEVPLTLLLEFSLLGIVLPVSTYLIIGSFLLILILLRWRWIALQWGR